MPPVADGLQIVSAFAWHRTSRMTSGLGTLFAVTFTLLTIAAPAPLQLREWIYGLSTSLSAQLPLNILSGLGVHVNLTAAQCEQLNIEFVEVPSAVGSSDELRFTAALGGVSVRCNLAVRSAILHEVRSNMALTLDGSVDVIVKAEGGLPAAIAIESCGWHIQLQPLQFEGDSTLAALLGELEPEIRYLGEHSSGLMCAEMRRMARDSTPYVHNLSEKVKALSVPAMPKVHTPSHGAQNLREFFWDGPVGRNLRAFMHDVGHVDDMARWNAVVSHLMNEFDMDEGFSFAFLRNSSIVATVPCTNKTMYANLEFEALALSSLASFTSLSADVVEQGASFGSGFVPTGVVDATIALVFPQPSAVFEFEHMMVNVAEQVALIPLRIRATGRTAVSGHLTFAAEFDPAGLARLQLDQMQHMSCASAMFMPGNSSLELLDLRGRLAILDADVSAPECSESSLEVQLLSAGASLAKAVNHSFGDSAIALLDGVLSKFGRQIVNQQVSAHIEELAPLCPATNFTVGHVASVDYAFRGVAGSCFAACAVIAVAATGFSLARRFTNVPDMATEAREPLQLSEPDSSRLRLFEEAALPVGVRWAMPCALLGNMALFVIAEVTVGVQVSGAASTPDVQWVSPSIFNLSISNTLAEMWASGSYPLTFIVVAFTIVWPFVKLSMMMYSWMVLRRPTRRGRLLVFLDQAGKWSLADNFVMTLMVVFMHVSWSGVDVTSEKFVGIKLQCFPRLEFYVFIVGTVLSLFLGHVMLAIHRAVAGGFQVDTAAPLALWREVVLGKRESHRGLVGVTVSLVIVLTFALLVVAFFTPVLVIDLGGVVGSFLDMTAQDRQRVLSFADFLATLDSQGDGYLALTMAFFVCCLPLLLLVALLFLWLLPLSGRGRMVCVSMCETLSAWSSLDVMSVALFGAVIGGDTYGIGLFLEDVLYSGNVAPICHGLRDIGLECLTISLEFVPECCVFFSATFVNLVVTQVIFRVIVSRARRKCTGSCDSVRS